MAPNNPLTTWGNEKTMNLNPLILTNIQSSPYFKVNLYELKTYHEVVDEIYYKVDHLEPWEKGSRKTAGQTGMCGGVRGVGAGGIVSSAYCLLYKLYTLKLTRKQLNGLISHTDSPYIRGLGFMYIRYTQDPKELWEWYEGYLDDEEEIDVKAGGGHTMTIGEMLRQWLVKLEWYSTLFPRIPVPVQKQIVQNLKDNPPAAANQVEEEAPPPRHIPDGEVSFGEAEKHAHRRPSSPPRRSPRRSPVHRRSPSPRRRSPRRQSRSPRRRSRSPRRRSRSPRRRSPYRGRSPVYSRRSPPRHVNDFARELERERERQQREKDRGSKRSRSRERKRSKERRRRSKDRERKKRSRSREKGSHSKERSSKRRSRSKEKSSKHKSRSKDGSSKLRSKSREKSAKHSHKHSPSKSPDPESD